VYATGLVVLLALVLLVYIWANRRSVDADDSRALIPAWLADTEVHLPVPALVGAVTWERAFSLLDLLPSGLGLSRPEAQLIEQEGRLALRLGSPGAETSASPSEPPPGDRTEAQMIRAIQRLDRTLVREIMRPINHVTVVRLKDTPPKRLLDICRRTGFTRIPCYENQITNLIGYINVYDLLETDTLPADLREMVTQALFVPEVARVDMVLREMIGARQQVAIVFDEFGGTSGWLSREDILEEIIGEVGDEYERPRRSIVETKDGFLADGETDLDDLKEEIGLDLPKRNCDTIAGYIYARLGRVPRRSEEIDEKGWRIRIAGLDRHRIRKVRLFPPAVEGEEEPSADRKNEE
jgi:Mg2+/Co2+ transporter CorC